MDKEKVQQLIKNGSRKKCPCGCEYFDTATVQVEVSAFSSGTGRSEILLIGVLVCKQCGREDKPSEIAVP